jgi:spore coat polysaccharide biosynthesis protein SpsF (cytidylyltransferase family)
MKKRRLVAALACRTGGSRLYGKPIQHIDPECRITILEQIIATLRADSAIDEIVLGIAEGVENAPFVEIAERWGLKHIWGDRIDVLQRLIDCGRAADATDVFRVTTECPFIQTGALLDRAWRLHVESGNDVTATDAVPAGTHFEIYRAETLQASHDRGGADERSERCSLYVRRHLADFQVQVVEVPEAWRRPELRLTVDYPEDLVVCRRVYAALQQYVPQIPLEKIVAFLDSRPDLTALVAPYASVKMLWTGAPAA